MASTDARISTAAENPLCARLQQKFSGRGMASADALRRADTVSISVGKTAKPQSAARARVRSSINPFEDTAEFAPQHAASSGMAKTVRFDRIKNTAAPKAERAAQSQAQRRTAAYEVTTPFATGAYSAAYQRAAAIRARAFDGSEAAASAVRQKQRLAAAKQPRVFSRAWFRNFYNSMKNPVDGEIKVEKAPVSKGVIISIVLVAAVVMMIIFSCAQISEFKKEISGLEAQKAEISEQIEQLSLDIDLRNDIRVIEQTATEDIGMVKSNQVQSKYITVGDGERVEVVDNGDDGDERDYGVFSTLMSAFSSNWDNLLDYIK